MLVIADHDLHPHKQCIAWHLILPSHAIQQPMPPNTIPSIRMNMLSRTPIIPFNVHIMIYIFALRTFRASQHASAVYILPHSDTVRTWEKHIGDVCTVDVWEDTGYGLWVHIYIYIYIYIYSALGDEYSVYTDVCSM